MYTPLEDGGGVADGGVRGSRVKRVRQAVFGWVEGSFDSPVEYFVLYLIFAQAVLLMASTMLADDDPACTGRHCVRLGERYGNVFETCEAVSVGIFTLEYLLRLWVCVEHPAFEGLGAAAARWRYMRQFFSLVDLASILPYWVSLLPAVGESPDFITALRIFRLVRLFKADKYINAFQMLGAVLAENGSLLVATTFYSVLAWFLSAALLFFTECDNPAVGASFQSIPAALFPTLLMLTGEFPIADFSLAGRFIAGFIAVVAVAIFAVPTAVLGSGFVKAVQQARQLEFTVET
mmetsp:Transcript_9864/g.25093  ORF Transcript_9864/g.25093 Transcript_9864/m.25093 type:complete len:292 (+) Transcript_9864:173-1048(+)|eukprot:jgi/Tetstr1/433899/TSEL_023079.t1